MTRNKIIESRIKPFVLFIILTLLLALVPAAASGASLFQETPEMPPEPDAVVPETGDQFFLEQTWWLWTIMIVISLMILLGLYFRARSTEPPERRE